MTKNKSKPMSLTRLLTRVPGLDTISNGGFYRGGIYLVQGKPGAGKTILGNQICFGHVASGEKALFVTLLTESHGRMLSHLRCFDFFDPKQVGTSINYVSGYQILEQEKLPGLLAFLRTALRESKATLLVIDGLITAGSIAESDLELKKFIHELQVFIELLGCTAVLFTGTNGDADQYAVRTMADGLIDLTFERAGMRIARSLEVVKMRGGSYVTGQHRVEISDPGITVYPRIEAILGSTPDRSTKARARVSLGIPTLDQMVGGGVYPASVTMLLGSSGSGKTIVGLSCLAAGAREKEPGLYFGFSETPAELLRNAEGLGAALSRQLRSKQIELLWQTPSDDRIPDEMAARLIAVVKERGIRRLFIDGIDGFRHFFFDPERTGNFFSALCNELRSLGVTTLLSEETQDLFGPEIRIPVTRLATITDNIVLLRHVELRARLHRLISVMKMRGVATDSALREFSIGEHGIEISPTFDSAEAILSGLARIYPGAPESTLPRAERGRVQQRRSR
ncbi:MAG TPA: ATPase domain-containing protein [Myxococcaceae bacterium]|nr:ATPase domain-containing protein [Myxococcaceae bacterium]